jgi:hypothetical protein
MTNSEGIAPIKTLLKVKCFFFFPTNNNT